MGASRNGVELLSSLPLIALVTVATGDGGVSPKAEAGEGAWTHIAEEEEEKTEEEVEEEVEGGSGRGVDSGGRVPG